MVLWGCEIDLTIAPTFIIFFGRLIGVSGALGPPGGIGAASLVFIAV
jgi:hypothetical protein